MLRPWLKDPPVGSAPKAVAVLQPVIGGWPTAVKHQDEGAKPPPPPPAFPVLSTQREARVHMGEGISRVRK